MSIWFKRIFDLTISFALMIMFIPVALPILALLIKLDSKGSVFFIQQRTGKALKPFACYKLRTMKSPSMELDSDEQRITSFGRWLRKTHIDELPQLLNVLKGDMSLVGPRPHMIEDTISFERKSPHYHVRHMVQPGITGLAQVNGYFGTVDSLDHLEKRVGYDIEYVFNWTILGDIAILVKSVILPIHSKA